MDTVSCLCGLPLLRTVEGNVTRYYVYRLASAGPTSEPVWKCPECGRVLDIGTTKVPDMWRNRNVVYYQLNEPFGTLAEDTHDEA